jgi:phosphoribosylglycinamide formyltransferase-1
MPLRLCVLISGSGTNLQALIDARDEGRLDIDIVHVISNVADAAGLERARRAGLASSVLEYTRFGLRDRFDRALAVLMAAGDPDLFVFAGFMRIVGNPVLDRYQGRMINLHPSLLPLYPGLETYRRAIDAGDRQHGASVHFLTDRLDGGPVISRVRVPIRPDDDSESLRRRLAPEEHRLIVATVELFQGHRVERGEDRVVVDGSAIEAPLLLGKDGTLHVQRGTQV